jgi:hypothetical protein
MGGKGTLMHCQWKYKLEQLWKSLESPQTLKVELPYDPAIPLLGI